MDISMKTCAIVLELLTVPCTDPAISTGCDSRVPGRLEGIPGKRIQLVSANFKGASKLSLTRSTWSYIMFVTRRGGGIWRYKGSWP